MPLPLQITPAHAALAELSVARLRVALETPDGPVPAGTVGTIVHVHRDAVAYEVEVFEPFNGVITVAANDLEA